MFLTTSPPSCTQSWIRDKESDGNPYVYGYWTVWEYPWISYVPKDGGPTLHVSLSLWPFRISLNLIASTAKDLRVSFLLRVSCGSLIGDTLVTMALEFLGAACAIILSVNLFDFLFGIVHTIIKQISYRMDNAQRNRLYGKATPESKVDTHELADKVCYVH